MSTGSYRFTFIESISMPDVEATLYLAIIGAEALYGESTVRMDSAYSIDKQSRVCVVDARNEVGRCIAQIFTGYLTRELGNALFTVRAVAAHCNEETRVPAPA